MQRSLKVPAIAVVVALSLSACGSGDTAESVAAQPAAAPATADDVAVAAPAAAADAVAPADADADTRASFPLDDLIHSAFTNGACALTKPVFDRFTRSFQGRSRIGDLALLGAKGLATAGCKHFVNKLWDQSSTPLTVGLTTPKNEPYTDLTRFSGIVHTPPGVPADLPPHIDGEGCRASYQSGYLLERCYIGVLAPTIPGRANPAPPGRYDPNATNPPPPPLPLPPGVG